MCSWIYVIISYIEPQLWKNQVVTANNCATEELNKGVHKTYFDVFGVRRVDYELPVHVHMRSDIMH